LQVIFLLFLVVLQIKKYIFDLFFVFFQQGLLQSSGRQRIACTRDEVGYLKDANGFYIFDSEGRMIKTDKETFNELLALELVQ